MLPLPLHLSAQLSHSHATLHLSTLSLTRPQAVKPSSLTFSSFSILSLPISYNLEPFHPHHPSHTDSLPVSTLSRPHSVAPLTALLSFPFTTSLHLFLHFFFFFGFSSSQSCDFVFVFMISVIVFMLGFMFMILKGKIINLKFVFGLWFWKGKL